MTEQVTTTDVDSTAHGIALARKAVEIAEDRQASDILLLDVRNICGYADAFVLMTVESKRQGQAIREAMHKGLKESGQAVLRTEGDPDSGWLLMDFNDVIVHIFAGEQRELYGLEQLWRSAVPLVRIQ